MNHEDLTGMKFNRLLVVNKTNMRSKRGCILWECRCDCGNIVFVEGFNLKNDYIKSCGCLRKEISTQRIIESNKKRIVHGFSGTRIYQVWKNMINRCNNPVLDSYKRYGDRGILVCNEWLDFIKFKEWALNNGYAEYLQIDRINNDGNYEPSNCRWATKIIQANNTSTNVLLTYKNKSQTASQWAQELGIKVKTIRNRIYSLKWSVEKTLNERMFVC